MNVLEPTLFWLNKKNLFDTHGCCFCHSRIFCVVFGNVMIFEKDNFAKTE